MGNSTLELLTETSYVLKRQRLPKKQLGQITQYTHLEKKSPISPK